MPNFFHASCAMLAGLAAAGLTAGAHAQDLADADAPEIVVTATRTPTLVERLPARITVIDRAEIESRGHVSVVDALRTVPGIVAVQNGTPGSLTSVFSRGANSKHTLALYDGIRLNDASAPNAQFNFGQDLLGDLARVEVLRGAASSIYGSDAIGGVVNLIPRRGANAPFAAYGEVSGGSFATLRGLAGAAGTLGAFSYGATVEGYASDGFNQTPDRFALRGSEDDGASIYVFSGNAEYRLNDILSVDLLARYREASSDFDTFSGGPTFSRRADDPDLEIAKDQYTVLRAGVTAALFEGALKTRLSAGGVDNAREERDGGAKTNSAEGERRFADLITTWTPKESAGPLNEIAVSFGVQWLDEAIDVPATAFARRVAESESNLGWFVTGQTGVGDFVDLTASLRLDDNEIFGEQTTFNVGLVHDLAWIGAPVRLTLAHGTSFKAPTLSERFSRSAFNVGNPGLNPEEGETTEFGVDVSPFKDADGRELTFGGAYFEGEIKNLIEYNFAQLRNLNIGRVEIEGFEAYAQARPVAWGGVRVNYTFTDANNAVLPTRPQLLRRPEHVYGLLADIRAFDRLSLALGWSWVGSRTDVNYSDAGAFLRSGGRIKGYNVGNLSATFDLTKALQVFARIDNLADETYEQPEAFAAAPRSGFVGVRGRF
jgi:vitamin B12 transporter